MDQLKAERRSSTRLTTI